MKNEFLLKGLILVAFMLLSYLVGYKFSPDRIALQEKTQKIKELENTIVQQQISNSYIIKHMANNPAIQNLNKNRNINAH